VTGTGPDYWWSVVAERRITSAKRDATNLARGLNLLGAAGHDPTRPPDQFGVVWFNNQVSRSGNFTGFLTDLAQAEQAILAAGSLQGDPYRTTGGSHVAGGLYGGYLALRDAPPAVEFGDATYPYEIHVLLITDSIANIFLDVSAANLNGGISNAATYPAGSACRSFPDVLERDRCQSTYWGGKTIGLGGVAPGMDRPITQAAQVGRDLLLGELGAQVNVLTLGNLSDLGLRTGVATVPDSYYPVSQLQLNPDGSSNIDPIVAALLSALDMSACVPIVAPAWATSVGVDNRPLGTSYVFPAVGDVTLRNLATDERFTTQILADPETGDLSYSLPGVPAGSYDLFARMYYRGADGVTRLYSTLGVGDDVAQSLAVQVTGEPQILDDLSIRLTGAACPQ
jgi:hypothetical protein